MLELVRFGFRKLWEGRPFIIRVATAGNEFSPDSWFRKMQLDAT